MPELFRDGDITGVLIKPLSIITDSRGWLTELFRIDEWPAEFHPVMAYISSTLPGVIRGPHEHRDQADLFCFFGPSTFKLRMWDNRRESQTFGHVTTIVAGQENPAAIVVPAGIVHAYKNVGDVEGLVINCPNRLYRGEGGKDPVDEVRYEDDDKTEFRMDW
jgi:dTDP-4-dehydrorhamnose 3,5-epimerase